MYDDPRVNPPSNNDTIITNTNLYILSVCEKLYNDGVIGFGVHRFARLAHRSTKVYYYQNSYVGRYSHTYYPSDKPYGKFEHDSYVAQNLLLSVVYYDDIS